jgi:hypothetical protein
MCCCKAIYTFCCNLRLYSQSKYIVVYLLKARTVEPEKQPLLAKDSETNIRFQATAANMTTEGRPLLGSRFLISKNRQPLLGNDSINTFPRQRTRIREWKMLSARALPKSYKEDNWGNQVSSLREAVKRRLESGNWRISTTRSCYQGTAAADTAGWKTLACAVVICEVWRLDMEL